MPKYHFRCNACQRRLSLFFTYEAYDAATPECPHCGSADLQRHISRIAVAKSEDSRLDSLADDSMLAGLDEENPRELGRFMRKMSQEMGEDLGEEFGEVVDRLEKGQAPEEIEAAMPELADSSGDDGGFGGFDDF